MFITAIKICWYIVQFLIGIHLILPILSYILYSLKIKTVFPESSEVYSEPDYAIIVTAYEETYSLPAVVNSLLKLNYQNYIIYIVADKCDVSDLNFKSEKVIILRPEQVLSSNTRSHFYAINRFVRQHERLTIIDSDNLVEPNYLLELNVFFDLGYLAVQGSREAKNLDSSFASLDAARDIYYHFYDGKVLFNLGSSATLAGSGMAFTTQLYKESLEHLDVSGAGFDKVLQAQILKRNLRIAFAPKAIVYDEKTSRADQLVNQRSRWINTWFKYFKYGFTILFSGLKNLSINQTLFGITLLRPPLFIFLILSAAFMFLNLFISPFISLIWLIGFILFITGFAMALSKSETDKRIYQSLSNIPRFMFLQLISLANARKANQRSVSTKHFHTIDIQKLPHKEGFDTDL